MKTYHITLGMPGTDEHNRTLTVRAKGPFTAILHAGQSVINDSYTPLIVKSVERWPYDGRGPWKITAVAKRPANRTGYGSNAGYAKPNFAVSHLKRP